MKGQYNKSPSSADVKNAWSYTSIPWTDPHDMVIKLWIRIHSVLLSYAQGQLYLLQDVTQHSHEGAKENHERALV